jgi:hypothetical protein
MCPRSSELVHLLVTADLDHELNKDIHPLLSAKIAGQSEMASALVEMGAILNDPLESRLVVLFKSGEYPTRLKVRRA